LPAPAYDAFDTTPAYETPITQEPMEDDPRMVWYRNNAEVLARKDQEEREAKQELLATAQAHLSKIYEVHAEGIHNCPVDASLTCMLCACPGSQSIPGGKEEQEQK
jgi:hypothetical protein